jgi:phage terminase small subunit
MSRNYKNVGPEILRKYKKVVDEYYVNGFNGTDAYIKHYPNSSRPTGRAAWCDIKKVPQVQEYIAQKEARIAEKYNVTHDEMMETLIAWRDSDITETLSLSEDELKELPIELRRLINKYKKVETTFKGVTTTSVELSFVSKEKALEMIAKHIGFYEKDNAQKLPDVIKVGFE